MKVFRSISEMFVSEGSKVCKWFCSSDLILFHYIKKKKEAEMTDMVVIKSCLNI